MIAKDFRYYKGSWESREKVELDEVRSDGMYITTCVVDVDLLLCGISVFPCGDGNSLKLSPELQLKIWEFVQEERDKITNSYTIRTYKGWIESGLPTFEDYCHPGDTVDKEMVDYFINSVPPVTLRKDCTQAGEAYDTQQDPKTGRWRSTYITFSHISLSLWRFEGYCFKGQRINRVQPKTRLMRRIEAVREEIKV